MAVNTRAYARPVTIEVEGHLHMEGRLMGVVAKSDEPQFKLCTPEGKRVQQFYRVANDDRTKIPIEEMWHRGQLARGIEQEDSDDLQVVDETVIDAAKKSRFEKNRIEFTVHPIKDMGQLFPHPEKSSILFELGRYIKPSGEKRERWFDGGPYEQNYDIVRTILHNGNVGLISQACVRTDTSEALYRGVLWRGHLVLQPQVYLSRLYEFEDVEFKPVRGAASAAKKLTDLWETPLDMENYIDHRAEQVVAAQAAAMGGESAISLVEKAKPKEVKEKQSILEAMEDILSTAQAS